MPRLSFAWSLVRAIALLASASSVLAAAACAAGEATPTKKGKDAGDSTELERPGPVRGLPPPTPPDYENEDAGLFQAGERKSTQTGPADAGTRVNEAGIADAASESGTTGALCTGVLKAGDLAIVELMIRAAEGSGDQGEWIELQSTRDCTLNLKGLRVSSPRGDAGIDSLEVGSDLLLPPNRIVLVATSRTATANNNLPGVLLVFPGEPTDVLKNDGDTITVSAGGATIDALTYPKFTNLEAGRSISFPVDCAWSERADWARWSYSFYTWSGALKGTPNADNTDVTCY